MTKCLPTGFTRAFNVGEEEELLDKRVTETEGKGAVCRRFRQHTTVGTRSRLGTLLSEPGLEPVKGEG